MDGDIAPLDKIYEIANAHDIMLMVDDAHGEGVLGNGGRGIVDHFHLHGKVDVEVGTLSKAFGVVGGVVAGNPVIIEWLRQRGRPFLFSSAVTPAGCRRLPSPRSTCWKTRPNWSTACGKMRATSRPK